MPTFSIQIDSNVAEVLRRFEVLPKRIQDGIRFGLKQGVSVMKGAIQRRITETFRTTSKDGLRKAIETEVDEARLEGRISASKNYAAVHEFGTVGKGGLLPDIVPVHARALRFELQTASRLAPVAGPYRRLAKPQAVTNIIFCKRVSIPARPWFFPAIEESLDSVPRQIRQQVNAALSHTAS